mgnify:CR=1 FL=1
MGVVDTCGHYLVILTQESKYERLRAEKQHKISPPKDFLVTASAITITGNNGAVFIESI